MHEQFKREVLDVGETMYLVGTVGLHIVECQDGECPCKEDRELYDVKSARFHALPGKRSRMTHAEAVYQSEVFLNHLLNKWYELATKKFQGSINLNMSYAFYLFKVIGNVHAALLEFNNTEKKRPTFKQ